MSDEEVIKRRLIFDGDGTGDDRRLNVLLKVIAKWVQTEGESPEEIQNVLDHKILSQLALCEHSRKRSELLTNTNKRQMLKYKSLHSEYEDKIVDIKNLIERQKVELEKAKVIKQNRIQYHLLAKNIASEPCRTETNEKLISLQNDLKELTEEKRRLDQKIDKRRKQFFVLSTSANQLHAMLDEESESVDDGMNTSLDDITNSPGPEAEPMSE